MPGFRDALKKVLKSEGGYVNHILDTGKRTNFGITQKVYEAYIGRKLVGPDLDAKKGQPMAEAETIMRNMPQGNAEAIYKKNYWDVVKGDNITRYTMAFLLFDQAVNRGPASAIKQAQTILGIFPDGKMGAETLKRLNATDESKFNQSYLQASETFYKNIVSKKPDQVVHLKGWLARLSANAKETASHIGTMNTGAKIGIGVIVFLAVGSFFVYKFVTSKGATISSISSPSLREA